MKIDELIYLQNPWFRDEKYLPKEVSFPRRSVFNDFMSEVTGQKQISALTGLRRVGKSTLLRQVIGALLKKQTRHPRQLLYFSFDQSIIVQHQNTLEEIINYYFAKIINKEPHQAADTIYLFLDEIQLIPYWQDIIKRFYDLNAKIKFIISGSSSLFINEKSKESLAGRIFIKYLPPLSFGEYQQFSQNHDFINYLDFGQFPELLEIKDKDKKIEYLKEGVIGKVIEIDLVKTYGIRKIVNFERLFWSLLPNAGWIIESAKLMADLGLKKSTLFKYLTILEKSLLINKVLNISGSFRSEKRLLRKLYPASANFLSLIPSSIDIGVKVETYICSILKEKFSPLFLYHQRGKEIDFLLPDKKIAIEVKYQENIHRQDYQVLKKYIADKKYQGIIVTKNFREKLKDENITCVPVEEFENF